MKASLLKVIITRIALLNLGAAGFQGEPGNRGQPGTVGVPGSDGSDGAMGPPGPRGMPGQKGEPVFVTPPQGTKGLPGILHLQTSILIFTLNTRL